MYWTDPGGVEASKEIASSLILRSGCLGCHATREKTGLPEISLICVIHLVIALGKCHVILSRWRSVIVLGKLLRENRHLKLHRVVLTLILTFNEQFLPWLCQWTRKLKKKKSRRLNTSSDNIVEKFKTINKVTFWACQICATFGKLNTQADLLSLKLSKLHAIYLLSVLDKIFYWTFEIPLRRSLFVFRDRILLCAKNSSRFNFRMQVHWELPWLLSSLGVFCCRKPSFWCSASFVLLLWTSVR